MDEDIVIEIPPELSAEPDDYRGHDGARRYFAGFAGMIDDVRYEAIELIPAGDAVIAHIRLSGRGASSGLDADLEAFVVRSWRTAGIVRMRPYAELQDAQTAAGGRSGASRTRRAPSGRRPRRRGGSRDLRLGRAAQQQAEHAAGVGLERVGGAGAPAVDVLERPRSRSATSGRPLLHPPDRGGLLVGEAERGLDGLHLGVGFGLAPGARASRRRAPAPPRPSAIPATRARGRCPTRSRNSVPSARRSRRSAHR